MHEPLQESRPAARRLGRPRSQTAASHAAILDAVYELLLEQSARELTMEAVARRAKVGKPTLYKWWPSKAALILAMFHERLAGDGVAGNADALSVPGAATAEQAIRARMQRLIADCNGLFGGVLADLIAEGQSDPALLDELHQRYLGPEKAAVLADVQWGKERGEFPAGTDAVLLAEAIFGPVYYRLLLRFAPLTGEYGEKLVDQVLRGQASGSALLHDPAR
ncbi:MAG TPA: TetR/AcrR family transcriptional regulator [Terracidiphilus sp.]|jgi:AcrR family transcriptional regulator